MAANENVQLGRALEINGLALYANLAACATDCSFCLLGQKHPERLRFARFVALIERFLEWRQRARPAFEIFHWIRYSYNFSLEDMRLWVALWQRMGRTPDLMIGGLPLMSESQVRQWLRERQALGIEEVHASFLGDEPLHDALCRRRGDYQYRWLFLQTAAALGMKLNVRFLLTRKTLPFLADVMQRAERLNAPALTCQAAPLFYMGSGAAFEEDRITEETRQALIEQYGSTLLPRAAEWKSEREWVHKVVTTNEPPEPVMLRLDPQAATIDRLEAQSCAEILADLRQRTERAYAAIPSRAQLARSVGETHSTRIYALPNDMERLWLDRYLTRHPVTFERELTHLSLVR